MDNMNSANRYLSQANVSNQLPTPFPISSEEAARLRCPLSMQARYPDPTHTTPPISEVELPVMRSLPIRSPNMSATKDLSPAPSTVFRSGPHLERLLAQMEPPALPLQPLQPRSTFRAPTLPQTPAPLASLPSSIPPLEVNPSTPLAIANLARFARPHYTTYPLTSSTTTTRYPVQPQRPPVLLPNHPVFLYSGRDLSSVALPTDIHGRPFFIRRTDGCKTNEGFGPGVVIHPDVKGEAAHVEKQVVEFVMAWDTSRMKQ